MIREERKKKGEKETIEEEERRMQRARGFGGGGASKIWLVTVCYLVIKQTPSFVLVAAKERFNDIRA